MTASSSSLSITPPLVSVRTARNELGGISSATFYRQVAKGRLQIVKIGSRSMVPRPSLEAAKSGR